MLGLSLGGLVAQVLAIDFPAEGEQLDSGQHFRALVADFTARGLHAGTARDRVEVPAAVRTTAKVVARDLFPEPDQAAWRDEVLERIGVNDVDVVSLSGRCDPPL